MVVAHTPESNFQLFTNHAVMHTVLSAELYKASQSKNINILFSSQIVSVFISLKNSVKVN